MVHAKRQEDETGGRPKTLKERTHGSAQALRSVASMVVWSQITGLKVPNLSIIVAEA